MARARLAAGAVLIGLLALCALLRLPEVRGPAGARNLEASYHMLLTVTAMRETPVRDHRLLPTVSLGRDVDKHIPWGKAIPLPSGDYVYTSFAPPGFIAPLLFFEATGLPTTLPSLMIFNLLLQGAACLALYALLRRLLAIRGIPPGRARLAALAGVSLQVFSAEALLSYGIVYWSQQLFQIVLLASLIVLAAVLERGARNCRGHVAALALLALLGTWTEWTGVVFFGGMAALLLVRGRRERAFLAPALAIGGAIAAALLMIFLHYAIAAGWYPTLRALGGRAYARSPTQGGPFDLILGYFGSYGLLIPLIALAAGIVGGRVSWSRIRSGDILRGTVPFVLICALIAVLENLLLMQHATQFSFDRLKAVVPAAIVLAIVLAEAKGRARMLWPIALVVALGQNCFSYRNMIAEHRSWVSVDRANQDLARQVAATVDLSCAVLATNRSVRGYANLLFHRGIYEWQTREQFLAALTGSERARRCGAVHLQGDFLFPELPHYRDAIVVRHNRVWRLRPR